jgi:predicted lactoylglutathione lyase
MVGVTVKDMGKSLEFYRRLGLDLPEGGDDRQHIEVKMQGEYTLFLNSRPIRGERPASGDTEDGYRFVLEFYLKEQSAVDAKYAELTDAGYESYRAPFVTPIGMYFALVNDPDGNTILLSADLDENTASQDR